MAKFRQTLVVTFMTLGLAVPSLAYAQHHGGGGGGGARTGGGARSTAHATSAPRSSGGSSAATTGSTATATPNTTAGSGRNNNTGNGTVGTAVARNTVTGQPGPVFGPWGRFIPWYSTGFGYGVGLVYNPYFSYGGLGYGYGGFYGGLAYGPWYDPFFYDPFNPYGYGYGGLGYGYTGMGYGYTGMGYGDEYGMPAGGQGQAPTTTHITGSIRLKVSPDTAQVYVDGVLAGTASEFDGLVGHHLTVEAGSHQLELRAEGYETYQETITVDANKTMTDRISLKKSK